MDTFFLPCNYCIRGRFLKCCLCLRYVVSQKTFPREDAVAAELMKYNFSNAVITLTEVRPTSAVRGSSVHRQQVMLQYCALNWIFSLRFFTFLDTHYPFLLQPSLPPCLGIIVSMSFFVKWAQSSVITCQIKPAIQPHHEGTTYFILSFLDCS